MIPLIDSRHDSQLLLESSIMWKGPRSQTRTVGDGYYCTIFVDTFLLLHTRVVIKSLADGHAPLLLDDRKVETVPMGMQDLGSKIF